MLWPFILPFQITCVVALTLLIFAPFVAKTRGKRPGRVFAWCLLLAAIGFVPSCASVMYVLDGFRFGIFHYPVFGDVRDFRVERYLPPPARDITIKIAPGSYSGDWVEYVGPSARNGAGFVIWYNSDSSIAYQRGGYW